MQIRSAIAAALIVLGLAGCTRWTSGATVEAAHGPPRPLGQDARWKLTFSDEFDGSSLDRSRWSDHSSAEPDAGRGNLGNQQLEWNQAANCALSGGQLVMTARRQQVTSPATGQRYGWTSCLITTRGSFAFHYGYLEERSILPGVTGFWPAFWTWQAGDVGRHIETDVYEFFSDNRTRLYGTQYSSPGGRCDWKPRFDPSTDWHTYGVAIQPNGTSWYVDGKRVCRTAATSAGLTNIISNLAVYSKIPPSAATSTATKRVDYIRAWARS
jgi:beta-glucanase (GH16 family)